MATEALIQSLTDRVRASLGDAMAEKLRVTRSELADVKRAMKDVERKLADEITLRKAAEADRDKAVADLIAALNRSQQTDDAIPLLLNSALSRIDGVSSKVLDIGKALAENAQAIEENTKAINSIPAGPSEIVFDVRRDSADKFMGVVARAVK